MKRSLRVSIPTHEQLGAFSRRGEIAGVADPLRLLAWVAARFIVDGGAPDA